MVGIGVLGTGYYLPQDIEDVVYLNLEFADDVAAHIYVTWLDLGKHTRSGDSVFNSPRSPYLQPKSGLKRDRNERA